MWNIFKTFYDTHLIEGSLLQITLKNTFIQGSLTSNCSWRSTGVKNSIWRKAQISTTFQKRAKKNKNEHQAVNHQYLQATKTGQRLLIIIRHGNTGSLALHVHLFLQRRKWGYGHTYMQPPPLQQSIMDIVGIQQSTKFEVTYADWILAQCMYVSENRDQTQINPGKVFQLF